MLKFSADEGALFSELVIQTIAAMRLGQGRRSYSEAAQFSVGDYPGGQSDMSCDQEIHEMLRLAEIIDSDLSLLLNAEDLPKHLSNGARFGIDITWAFECFIHTLTEWHPAGEDHPIVTQKQFEVPAELEYLGSLLLNVGFVQRTGQQYEWAATGRSVLGLIFWGSETELGRDAQDEARQIFSQIPEYWKTRIKAYCEDRRSNDPREIEKALSNYWYNNQWNDAPVRGAKSPVNMRSEMGSRLYLMGQLCV